MSALAQLLSNGSKLDKQIVDYMTKTVQLESLSDFANFWTSADYERGVQNDIVTRVPGFQDPSRPASRVHIARLRAAWNKAKDQSSSQALGVVPPTSKKLRGIAIRHGSALAHVASAEGAACLMRHLAERERKEEARTDAGASNGGHYGHAWQAQQVGVLDGYLRQRFTLKWLSATVTSLRDCVYLRRKADRNAFAADSQQKRIESVNAALSCLKHLDQRFATNFRNDVDQFLSRLPEVHELTPVPSWSACFTLPTSQQDGNDKDGLKTAQADRAAAQLLEEELKLASLCKWRRVHEADSNQSKWLVLRAALRQWQCWLHTHVALRRALEEGLARAAAHDEQRICAGMILWWSWQVAWYKANPQPSAFDTIGFGIASKPPSVSQEALLQALLFAMRQPVEAGRKVTNVFLHDMDKPDSPTENDKVRVIESSQEITYSPAGNHRTSGEEQVIALRKDPTCLEMFCRNPGHGRKIDWSAPRSLALRIFDAVATAATRVSEGATTCTPDDLWAAMAFRARNPQKSSDVSNVTGLHRQHFTERGMTTKTGMRVVEHIYAYERKREMVYRAVNASTKQEADYERVKAVREGPHPHGTRHHAHLKATVSFMHLRNVCTKWPRSSLTLASPTVAVAARPLIVP